jgi:hypothetical protein
MRLFFILLVIIPSVALAQPPKGYYPGYGLTVKGDTIHGLIAIPVLSVFNVPYDPFWFLFRDTTDNYKKRKFARSEVRGFRLDRDSVVYEMRLLDTVAYMAKIYTDTSDYLAYYEIQTSRGLDNFYHVLQKKGDAGEVWYSDDAFQGFKKRVTGYLHDDAELCDKIEKGIYKRADIVRIIREYNALHAKKE